MASTLTTRRDTRGKLGNFGTWWKFLFPLTPPTHFGRWSMRALVKIHQYMAYSARIGTKFWYWRNNLYSEPKGEIICQARRNEILLRLLKLRDHQGKRFGDVASTALDNFLVIVLDKILVNVVSVAYEADHITCVLKPLDSFKAWSGRRIGFTWKLKV